MQYHLLQPLGHVGTTATHDMEGYKQLLENGRLRHTATFEAGNHLAALYAAALGETPIWQDHDHRRLLLGGDLIMSATGRLHVFERGGPRLLASTACHWLTSERITGFRKPAFALEPPRGGRRMPLVRALIEATGLPAQNCLERLADPRLVLDRATLAGFVCALANQYADEEAFGTPLDPLGEWHPTGTDLPQDEPSGQVGPSVALTLENAPRGSWVCLQLDGRKIDFATTMEALHQGFSPARALALIEQGAYRAVAGAKAVRPAELRQQLAQTAPEAPAPGHHRHPGVTDIWLRLDDDAVLLACPAGCVRLPTAAASVAARFGLHEDLLDPAVAVEPDRASGAGRTAAPAATEPATIVARAIA